MLWKFFRTIPSVTAYYEPLHQELLHGVRFNFPVLERHYGVENYFNEFKALGRLGELWSPSFARRKLFLGPEDEDEQLEKYIDYLIEAAPGRPVLKFNRIDFRLPWIRNKYPNARVVHIFRDVRKSWVSSLRVSRLTPDCGKDADICSLKTWCDDLLAIFPFLALDQINHAYQRFYYIWKLSLLFGKCYSDISISYDEWMSDYGTLMNKLVKEVNLDCDLEGVMSRNPVVRDTTDLTGFERDENWYEEKERECEHNLREHGFIDSEESDKSSCGPLIHQRIKRDLERELQGSHSQLIWLHQELSDRLMQIYEKENIIQDLVSELNEVRTAANDRLDLIGKLTSVAEERLKLIQILDSELKRIAKPRG